MHLFHQVGDNVCGSGTHESSEEETAAFKNCMQLIKGFLMCWSSVAALSPLSVFCDIPGVESWSLKIVLLESLTSC